MDRVIQTQGKSNVRVTVHSLGSNMYLHVGETYNIHKYHYISHMSVRQAKQSIENGI